jgi:[CysO sulfur-carrier protein]-S-L-cysteine hydrolase
MIQIPDPIYRKMVEHAKKEWPLECCGILSGKGKSVEKVFELQNSEGSAIRYSISSQEQLRVFEEMEKDCMEMIAIYHSHPHTIPFPSETDVKMALYPEVSSIIISLKEENNPVVKGFLIREEAIYPDEIQVIPSL